MMLVVTVSVTVDGMMVIGWWCLFILLSGDCDDGDDGGDDDYIFPSANAYFANAIYVLQF